MDKLNTVMLVDDDDATNFLHKYVIESSGLTNSIYIAEDGHEALNYLSENQDKCNLPNIIFLDLNMPFMNGWEFLDNLKKMNFKAAEDTYICILTTSENPEDREKASQIALVDNFQTKLLDKDTFEQIAYNYLKNL